LQEAEGNVKVAIVMAKLGARRAAAESKLAAAGGLIAEALKG